MKPKALLVVILLAFVSVVLLVVTFYDTKPAGRFVSVLATAVYVLALHYVALWFLISRRFGAQRAQTAVVNISLLIATVAAFSIGAELFLRFMFRDVTTTADNLSYFSKHWLKTVRYNRWGFRERDFDPIKPSRTSRMPSSA